MKRILQNIYNWTIHEYFFQINEYTKKTLLWNTLFLKKKKSKVILLKKYMLKKSQDKYRWMMHDISKIT